MFTRKIRILTFILIVFAMVLSACAPAAVEEPTDVPVVEDPTADESATDEPVVEEPEEIEPTTIDVWLPGGVGRDEGVAAIVEAFNEIYPQITVNLTAFPFGEYLNSIQVALAGTEPPDVAYFNGTEIQNFAFNGALLPLDDYVTEDDRADFMPDLLDMVTYDGVMYGLPFENAAVAHYYNVDYFEAAGIEVPKTLADGWTWEEFATNIKTVQADQAAKGNEIWGIVGFGNPFRNTFWAWTIVRSFAEPGSPLWESISSDYTTVSGYIDTEEAIVAYTFYQSLYTDGIAPQENIPDAFGNGLSATMLAVPASGNGFTANFPDLNWGVMPLPYGKTPLTHTGSFAPVVMAKSDSPDAASLFATFFSSPEGFLAYHGVTPTIAGRLSLLSQLPEYQEGYLGFLVDEMVEWGQARPGGPAHTIFNKIVCQDMIINIALGGDIVTTVEAAVLELEAQLAQFGD